MFVVQELLNVNSSWDMGHRLRLRVQDFCAQIPIITITATGLTTNAGSKNYVWSRLTIHIQFVGMSWGWDRRILFRANVSPECQDEWITYKEPKKTFRTLKHGYSLSDKQFISLFCKQLQIGCGKVLRYGRTRPGHFATLLAQRGNIFSMRCI